MRNRGYDVQANEKHGGTLAEYIHAFDVKDSFTLSVTNRADGVTDEQYTREFYNQMKFTIFDIPRHSVSSAKRPIHSYVSSGTVSVC